LADPVPKRYETAVALATKICDMYEISVQVLIKEDMVLKQGQMHVAGAAIGP
jgi:hypothetical protein